MSQYKIKRGDSYWNIAKSLLGGNASDAAINARRKAIQKLNNGKALFAGGTLNVGGAAPSKMGHDMKRPGYHTPAGHDTQRPGNKTGSGHDTQRVPVTAKAPRSTQGQSGGPAPKPVPAWKSTPGHDTQRPGNKTNPGHDTQRVPAKKAAPIGRDNMMAPPRGSVKSVKDLPTYAAGKGRVNPGMKGDAKPAPRGSYVPPKAYAPGTGRVNPGQSAAQRPVVPAKPKLEHRGKQTR